MQFIDALHAKIRRDVVDNDAIYVIIGIDEDGYREILDFVIGTNESSYVWEELLSNLKDRGVREVLLGVMDGLPGIEDAFHKVYPKADIQRCVVHKVRNSIRKIRKRDYQKFTESLKSIYKAPSHEQALIMLDTLGDKWAHIYPEIVADWRENHENLLTFFKYPTTIRQSIYTNNWIERTYKEFQRRLKTKDSMPTVKAAEKIIYMQSLTMNQKWSKRKMRGFASAYDDLQDIFEVKYGN